MLEKPKNDWFEDAKTSLKESALLRSKIDHDVLKDSSKRLRDQADAVDIALARFISDTHNIRIAIENDLKQVIKSFRS